MRLALRATLSLVILASLAACGGGDPVSPTPVPPPPPATQTVALEVADPGSDTSAVTGSWHLLQVRSTAPLAEGSLRVDDAALRIVIDGADVLIFSLQPQRTLRFQVTVPTAQAPSLATQFSVVSRVNGQGTVLPTAGWQVRAR